AWQCARGGSSMPDALQHLGGDHITQPLQLDQAARVQGDQQPQRLLDQVVELLAHLLRPQRVRHHLDLAERILDLLPPIVAVGVERRGSMGRGHGPPRNRGTSLRDRPRVRRWSSGTSTATSTAWMPLERRTPPRVPVNAAAGTWGLGTLYSTRSKSLDRK